MEVRRGGDQHDVDTLDHLLIGIEADEQVVVVDGDLVRFEPSAAVRVRPGHAVLEDVGHGHEPHVGAGVHGVHGCPAASATAADQADPDLVAAGGVSERERASGVASVAPAAMEDFRKLRRVVIVGFSFSVSEAEGITETFSGVDSRLSRVLLEVVDGQPRTAHKTTQGSLRNLPLGVIRLGTSNS